MYYKGVEDSVRVLVTRPSVQSPSSCQVIFSLILLIVFTGLNVFSENFCCVVLLESVLLLGVLDRSRDCIQLCCVPVPDHGRV
ncbi:hypothetical protein M6B38_215495 [Iris pallida]|uniref:Uncharacterized protein n=1 Tax=Iris pallida TaxID=29817 RepID=A0AAX6E1L3_IRIPA|nr:hypothetical protein M6B38_215495 [Iris pallida]